MKQLQKDIRTILNCANTISFEERKAYNRLLDFIQLDSIYQGIPVEDSCDDEKTSLEDITGIVKTDEPTNSVELKKELYK